MSSLSACKAMKAWMEGKPAINDALTGLIWTRRIMPNVSVTATPTPASTPEAFDDHKRVKPCCSIIPLPESTQFGRTYLGGMELVFWCLPHDSAKQIVDDVISSLQGQCDPATISINGKPAMIRYAGRVGFFDDPEVPNSVVDRVTIQIDYTRER